jgi:hypothetical protein
VLNAVAVRANHFTITDRVQPAIASRLDVVDIAKRLVPPASLASVAVLPTYCIGPRLPAFENLLVSMKLVGASGVPRLLWR